MEPNSLYNHPSKGFVFFLLCCIVWWVMGLIMTLTYSPEVLFKHFNSNYSDWGDIVMVWVTRIGEAPIMIIVFFSLILFKKSFRQWQVIVIIILGIALPAIINNILKQIASYPRPLNVYSGEPWVHIVEGYKNNMNNSFPSGHTAGAFAFMGMLAALLKPKYYMAAGIFFILALFTGFSRIYLAQHFFIDVVFGSMVGTVLLFLILTLWKKYILQKYPIH